MTSSIHISYTQLFGYAGFLLSWFWSSLKTLWATAGYAFDAMSYIHQAGNWFSQHTSQKIICQFMIVCYAAYISFPIYAPLFEPCLKKFRARSQHFGRRTFLSALSMLLSLYAAFFLDLDLEQLSACLLLFVTSSFSFMTPVALQTSPTIVMLPCQTVLHNNRLVTSLYSEKLKTHFLPQDQSQLGRPTMEMASTGITKKLGAVAKNICVLARPEICNGETVVRIVGNAHIADGVLFTATHVLKALGPQAIAIRDGKQFAFSTERFLTVRDIAHTAVPKNMQATLGMQSAVLAPLNMQIALSVHYSLDGNTIYGSVGGKPLQTLDNGRTFKYDASTVPGASGGVVLQNGKVVGMHSGAISDEGVNFFSSFAAFHSRTTTRKDKIFANDNGNSLESSVANDDWQDFELDLEELLSLRFTESAWNKLDREDREFAKFAGELNNRDANMFKHFEDEILDLYQQGYTSKSAQVMSARERYFQPSFESADFVEYAPVEPSIFDRRGVQPQQQGTTLRSATQPISRSPPIPQPSVTPVAHSLEQQSHASLEKELLSQKETIQYLQSIIGQLTQPPPLVQSSVITKTAPASKKKSKPAPATATEPTS